MTKTSACFLFVWTCSLLPVGSNAFQSPNSNTIGFGNLLSRTTTHVSSSTTQLNAVGYETCVNVGFKTVVPKPLGIVFGENPDPYYGLVVDDVAEGLNGGKAGLRVGDQLMAINGNVVVGKDFDTVMGMLQSASGKLDLVLYRGPVTMLFTILGNQLEEGEYVNDDEDGEEEIIMDENYESPVRIEVKEKKPLSPADLFKAMGKVGKMMFDDNTSPEDKPQQKKKQQGFFGIGAETIQLDGDDANTLK